MSESIKLRATTFRDFCRLAGGTKKCFAQCLKANCDSEIQKVCTDVWILNGGAHPCARTAITFS